MNLFLRSLLVSLFVATPAFAQNAFCPDTQDSDYIINLEVENGQVVNARYSNQDHGSFDDRTLSSSEYSFNGSSLVFGGDTYNCW